MWKSTMTCRIMAPNTELSLAKFALTDALRALDTLRNANQELIRSLERADEQLTWAEERLEQDPHNEVLLEGVGNARADYEDTRIIYDDVFGGAERDIRQAHENVLRLQ